MTVRVAVLVVVPALAVIVTGVDVATPLVPIANVAVVAPCATVTFTGTVATDVLLLESDTTNPPDGAAAVSVTVPCDPFPPTTDAGLTETAESAAGGGTGVTVNVAVRVTVPAFAVIVTGVDVVTALVPIANVAVVEPCATVTLAGTVATVLLLDSDTANPPLGAAAVSVTVPCDPFPPTTEDGLTETAESAAVAGADCGVKLRVDDHAPLVPAELRPLTRHQCCCVASDVTVNCDVVTVWSITRGVVKLLWLSTWI